MIRRIEKSLHDLSVRQAETRGRNILKDLLYHGTTSDTTDFTTTKIKEVCDATSITDGYKFGYEIKMRDYDRFESYDSVLMESEKYFNLSFFKSLHNLNEIYYVVIYGVNAEQVYFFRLSDITDKLENHELRVKALNCNKTTLRGLDIQTEKVCLFLPKEMASSRFSFNINPFGNTGKYEWLRYN